MLAAAVLLCLMIVCECFIGTSDPVLCLGYCSLSQQTLEKLIQAGSNVNTLQKHQQN